MSCWSTKGIPSSSATAWPISRAPLAILPDIVITGICCCPPYPLRSDTSIGRLAEVCQGLRRDTGQGWLGSKSRSTVYGTITFPTTGATLGTRFSSLNSYSPGESKRITTVPSSPGPRVGGFGNVVVARPVLPVRTTEAEAVERHECLLFKPASVAQDYWQWSRRPQR